MVKRCALGRASDISRKKKQNFAGFSGANSRKNRPISRDFRGRKVKFRRIFRGKFLEESAAFAEFFGGNLAKIDQFCVDMTNVV